MENEIDDKLEQKVNKEYQDFSNNIKQKTKDEIFDNAYEIIVKNEMKDLLRNMSIIEEEKEMLLKHNNLLEELYKNWLQTNTPLGEILHDSVIETIVNITSFQNRQDKINDERDF